MLSVPVWEQLAQFDPWQVVPRQAFTPCVWLFCSLSRWLSLGNRCEVAFGEYDEHLVGIGQERKLRLFGHFWIEIRRSYGAQGKTKEEGITKHRRRKVESIGGPRFRILGRPRGGGGANSQQAHDVVTTSMLRNDVASTSFRRLVPIRFLINQCQIITFLILKYDITENSRIELRGIVLPVQVGGLLGGPKGMLAPLSNYWGGLAPPGPPLFLRLW